MGLIRAQAKLDLSLSRGLVLSLVFSFVFSSLERVREFRHRRGCEKFEVIEGCKISQQVKLTLIHLSRFEFEVLEGAALS